MTNYELIEYIQANDKIIDVLEGLGCHKIKLYSKEYRCALPNHQNATAISVKKETLKVKIFTKEGKTRGDLFTLTMYIFNCSFYQAIVKLHRILNLKYEFNYKKENKKTKKDILKVFKKALDKNYENFDDEKLNIYHKDMFQDYYKMPYIGWVREGILPYTQNIFNIGYIPSRNRVCIPHRLWCGKSNDFVGMMGRTLVEHYDLLDIPKYYPIQKFPKSMNLYGLQENYVEIQKHGIVVVFEAEKSTLKAHSINMPIGVSLGGHELSPEHIKILISLDVEIVIALDNDMEEQLSIDMCNRIKNNRRVSYIYDKWELLGKKDSPIDKGSKIFKFLLKHRVKVNSQS